MLELFFIELYDWGVLQTDPNFGNYLMRARSAGRQGLRPARAPRLRLDDALRR
jgi:hypothetical protein